MSHDSAVDALDRVDRLRDAALQAIESAGDTKELEAARVRYAGRKSELSRVMSFMGKLPPVERPRLGNAVNAAKDRIEGALRARGEALGARELENRLMAERLDVTLPGTAFPRGCEHPLLKTVRDILAIFEQMGYAIHEGPEVEWDRYNFELLNIPPDHPARDMQDTFYLTEDMLLRTQTSPNQLRVMHAHPPPIRVVVPGFVYRNEAEDASHGDQFYQIEGLCVDTDISLGDLKGTLTEVAHRFFGPDRRTRFRPSYFPFTEPSAEMDIECVVCKGAGCRSCGYEGWLELGGSGMVHPHVLVNGGYDPEKVSGFAFGIGPDRYTMMKYGITDLRLFRENDLRFLRQFV
ncbi:MAG: phenylalanine--tRNA ligase subunit alpha [Chloroflexota bacterium]|nr:MAG: phenylalanine--tRNA ligase subunit alpha [Chloroflexota bacterium]